MRNTLFRGDNLGVLRQHVGGTTVEMCCLDSPFKSNPTEDMLLKKMSLSAFGGH